MQSEIKNILTHSFVFENFTNEDLSFIKDSFSIKEIMAGEHIFMEGQDASAFFIIGKGKIKVYRVSKSGDELILGMFLPGDTIAEAAVFDSGIYPASAMASEDSVLVRISKRNFISGIRNNPDLALKMLNSYSKKMRHLVNIISDISFKDIKSRLANYILNNSTIQDNLHFCVLDITKKELSALLSTIPETISRAFDFYKKKKIITEQDKKIIILDEEKLKLYAEM
jgi:CRP/FNR family transcriptional regulator, dissimilatory nitrate respiration regulator